MIFNSKQTKDDRTIITHYEANQQINIFITELEADLESLKGDSFQRHTPEYYDEVMYYNNFHQTIPQSLLLSNCYLSFINVYRTEGKSLFEAVSAFLEEYKKGELVYVSKIS